MFFKEKISSLAIGLTLGLGLLSNVSLANEIYGLENPELELPIEVMRFTLAEIQLSNGSVIEFTEIPEIDALELSELTDGGPAVLEELEGDILQKFLQLTSDDIPVPQALIDYSIQNLDQSTDIEGEGVLLSKEFMISPFSYENFLGKETQMQLAKRNKVIELVEPLYIDLTSLTLNGVDTEKYTSNELKLSGGGCGPDGSVHFKLNTCYYHPGSGTEQRCDSSGANRIQRTSLIKGKMTHTRTVACGTHYGARIYHQYLDAFGFNNKYISYMPRNSYRYLTTYYTVKRYRRIVARKFDYHDGYIRNFTSFQ